MCAKRLTGGISSSIRAKRTGPILHLELNYILSTTILALVGPQIQANDSVNNKSQSLVLARIRHCTKYKEHIHDLNSHRQPNKHVFCLFYFIKNKKQLKSWGDKIA